MQIDVGDILYTGVNLFTNGLLTLIHTGTKGAISHMRTLRGFVG